jgi:hypothetical protein
VFEALYIGISKFKLIGPISFLAIDMFVLVYNVILDSNEISYPPLNFLTTHSTILVF